MDIIQIVILAGIQGITEFLPISSSAHLILAPQLLGWPDQGLAFDVAVHIGTLTAVVWYFRRELIAMSRDMLRMTTRRQSGGERFLVPAVIIGTVPAGVFGLFGKDLIEIHLRSPIIIAITTLAFGLLLWFADRRGARRRDEHTLNLRDALIIGCFQALALIPGVSRSGITITAALLLGLNRQAAARFSFLLSIPLIAAAGLLLTYDLQSTPNPTIDWTTLGLGAAIAAIAAYSCIYGFLKLMARTGLTPYIIYRLLLGVVLLVVFQDELIAWVV